jgi:hypothetical protein
VTLSLEKFTAACQANLPGARIADSNSKNAVNFSSARTTKRERASENDWRAAAEWLRLTFPQDYRRASTPTTATTNITNQTLVISPPARVPST